MVEDFTTIIPQVSEIKSKINLILVTFSFIYFYNFAPNKSFNTNSSKKAIPPKESADSSQSIYDFARIFVLC